METAIKLEEYQLETDLYTYDFSSSKDVKSFINNCKRIIRSSHEYREWVSYIKFTKQYSYCQFTNESASELSIDIHHHPYSMESLVKIVFEHHMSKYQKVCTFDIAKEIMELHYSNNIGFVLLIRSLHEKFHNGYLRIPMEIVVGNWKKIEELYYIPEEVAEVVNNYKIISINDVPKLKWSEDYVIYDDGY